MIRSKSFIFFTLNDFTKDGGGTIRMKGIVNALAELGETVVFLSNTQNYDAFHPSIKHVFLDMTMSKNKKRKFQFLLSLLPICITKHVFKIYTKRIEKFLEKEKLTNQQIISFEYLDNSMVYFLKEQNIISNYMNDTHGIAPLEFFHRKTDNLIENLMNKFKYMMTLRLDKKVMNGAKGLIFVSEAMKDYFERKYAFVCSKENYILRDGVSSSLCRQTVDETVIENYRKTYNILPKDKIVLFAGNFKELGGVLDLLQAFYTLVAEKKRQDIKLFLLGEGEDYQKSKQFVRDHKLSDKVIFTGRTLYIDLRNYQELGDVIVCPDKQHPFSELVPHIKYFDSLASGKVVINGSFASVKEINSDEKFSIDFEPSNVIDLANKIEMVLQDLEYFTVKYRDNKKIICNKFTYDNFVKVLLK